MSKHQKTLDRILRGNADANIRFADLRQPLTHLGFTERVRGGRHIFAFEGIEEIVNLQSKGRKAKAYQVKQVRGILVAYEMVQEKDETDGDEDHPKAK